MLYNGSLLENDTMRTSLAYEIMPWLYKGALDGEVYLVGRPGRPDRRHQSEVEGRDTDRAAN